MQAPESNDLNYNKELPISKCVNIGKSSNIFLSQVLHLKMRIIIAHTTKLIVKFNLDDKCKLHSKLL